MILLGIDTASDVTSIGLCKHGQPPYITSFPGPNNQLERIGVVLERIMVESGIKRSSISALVVDVGPGLFSGLRVGVSFAKSFAGAIGVPIIPLTSLDILAFSQKNCPRLIVSVLDARRGEVFYSTYKKVPGGVTRLGPYLVASPENVAVEIESIDELTLLVGHGANRYQEVFSTIPQVQFAGLAMAYPLTAMMFELAQPMFYSEQFVSPENVEVVYIRDADAKVNFEVRKALKKES
jgi:tRNA threonylcarbamoyladenosine biosynthesis protein TsaB